MARRNVLAVSKIPEFASWLTTQGWTITDCKGYYEVLRATHPHRKPIVIYGRSGNNFNNDRLVHATIQQGCPSWKLVHRWLRERKKKAYATDADQSGDVGVEE